MPDADGTGATMRCRDDRGRFTPGWRGRPKGALNKRRQTAQEIFDKYHFDPLEKKILLCKRIENKLRSNHFKDTYEKIEYLKLYAETLKDVLQYSYQKLKAVEHVGQLELIQKLQHLDACTDEELAALLAEAEEIARGGTLVCLYSALSNSLPHAGRPTGTPARAPPGEESTPRVHLAWTHRRVAGLRDQAGAAAPQGAGLPRGVSQAGPPRR